MRNGLREVAEPIDWELEGKYADGAARRRRERWTAEDQVVKPVACTSSPSCDSERMISA
jgi:hypothetical protein